MKLMAERAVVYHLKLNDIYYDKDSRIHTEKNLLDVARHCIIFIS